MPADAARRPSRVPIVIPGVGIVTAAGRGVDATLSALRGRDVQPGPPRNITTSLAANYPVFEVSSAALEGSSTSRSGGKGRRHIRLALAAAEDAMASVSPAIDRARFGVVVGATVGGMNHTEDWVEAGVRGGSECAAARPAIRHLPFWGAPGELARRFGLGGPSFAIVTACTGGAQAIATGAELIESGVCDAVLAGGVDVLSRLTYHGFASLRLLSERRCAPFDADRNGLNLGEGAAFVVLVRSDLIARGDALAQLVGWGSTADAFHATAPRPDGSGPAGAFTKALEVGGIAPADIGWVHAHGTATVTNDAVESAAVRSVFGARAVAVSSTKHLFGHTLGAAGAVSGVVAVLAIRGGFVPANAPIERPDPACGIRVVAAGDGTPPARHVLVSSLGFGGASCALVFSRCDP